jgi:hypothetical protein
MARASAVAITAKARPTYSSDMDMANGGEQGGRWKLEGSRWCCHELSHGCGTFSTEPDKLSPFTGDRQYNADSQQ